MINEREFDVVIYGATGFTGNLVLDHLCKEYICKNDEKKKIPTIAIAGRNRERLEAVKKSCCQSSSPSCRCSNIEILVADSNDPSSLINMCTKTKVVLSSVGPFIKYGETLVSACVAASTHYLDITGELMFVSEIMKKYGKDARDKKIKLVSFCGFDSVPSDLSVLLLEEKALEVLETPVQSVRLGIVALKGGGLSGGTIASFMAFMEANGIKECSTNFLLCKNYEQYVDNKMKAIETPQPKVKLAGWDKDFGYTSFFATSEINENVVRFSNYLQRYKYGKEFEYHEFAAFKRYNYLTSRIEPFVVFLIFALLKFRLFRWIVSFFLPKPGEGPSRKDMDSGHFLVEAKGEVKKAENTYKFVSKVGSKNGDPGYKETAKMLAESALCVALDMDKCTDQYGVCTPASGIGAHLSERLKAIGFTVDVSYSKI